MKKCFVAGLSLVASMLMVGCGSSGSSGESPLSGETFQIEDQQSAQNAVASLSTIGDSVGGINDFNDVILYEDSAGLRSVTQTRETETWGCSGGGTITMSGDSSDTAINSQATFSNCVEDDGTINGVMGLNGSMDNQNNMNLVTSFTDFVVVEPGLTSTLNLTLTMDANYLLMDPISLKLTGTAQTGSTRLGYDNYIMQMSGYNSTFNDFNEYEINGKSSFESQDASLSCANGIYEVSTLETITRDATGFSGGKLRVNGAVIEFQSGNTATVTYANGETDQITQGTSVVCD